MNRGLLHPHVDESGNQRLAPWGILILALCFRLYGLTGDMFYDPVIYAQEAYRILKGSFTLATHSWYPHRLTIFVPVAPIYALFGVSSLTSRLWPLCLSLLQIGLVLWIGRRLFDQRVALLAGLLVALYPLDVVSAGVLQPDIVLSAFITGAVLFWILGMEGNEASRRSLLLSGIFLGLALITRANAPIILVFYAGYMIWRRPRLSAVLWFALGTVIVVIPVVSAYTLQTGDPLYRIGVVFDRFGSVAKSEGGRFLFYPSLLQHVRYSLTGLFAPLFMLGILGSFPKPTHGRGYMLLWAIPILLYLQYGSMSFTEYVPMLKRDRFLAPVTVPLALLTSSVLLEWVPRVLRRILPVSNHVTVRRGTAGLMAAGILVLAFNAWSIVRDHRTRGTHNFEAFENIVSIIRSEPELPVLFDHWRSCYRFSYYLDFEEGFHFYVGSQDATRMGHPGSFSDSRLGYLIWYQDPSNIPEALIVLDDIALTSVRAGDNIAGTYRAGEIPEYAYATPASWHLLGHYGSLRIFRNEPPR